MTTDRTTQDAASLAAEVLKCLESEMVRRKNGQHGFSYGAMTPDWSRLGKLAESILDQPPTPVAPESRPCPLCGNAIPLGDEYCPDEDCYTRLAEPVAAPESGECEEGTVEISRREFDEARYNRDQVVYDLDEIRALRAEVARLREAVQS